MLVLRFFLTFFHLLSLVPLYFTINIPINNLDEDITNILEEYGLKESECNYMITEFPCKTINLTYEDKIVNKEDKIQNSKISI